MMKGICLGVPDTVGYPLFLRVVEEVLPAAGYDTLVLLIQYHFPYRSHPDVAHANALAPAQVREIATACRRQRIRLIPGMNLLGHQSGKDLGTLGGLLRVHPEFDETPDLAAVRYCRSLCPRHPEVADVVCGLMDEMLDGFQADALHVGCDEVFEIGHCPRCRGIPAATLFADWIKTLHANLVGKRHVEMLMWSDRLLDGEATGYGEWEASMNQTHPAVDLIPRDILCCDWHYEARAEYPSVPFLTEKGFRTVVCPWRDVNATRALLDYTDTVRTDKLAGVLQTSWYATTRICRALLDAAGCGDEEARQVADSFRVVAEHTQLM